MHHTSYGCHRQGINFFPVCLPCHLFVCHHPNNWIEDKKNPVKKSRNQPEFTEKLKQNYLQLKEAKKKLK